MESILLKDIIQKPISGEWGLEDLYGTGIPVLRTANFTNEGIINFENVVTRNISSSKLKGKLLQKGDILLEKSGGSDKQPVGRVVYFDGQADKYGFNNFTSALRISDLTMWNPKYIFYALYANYHHGGTRKYENKTTGLHNLKVDLFIRSFSVPYATLIKQNEIVKKLDLLNHLENVCEVQLQKLDELVKSRFIEMFGDPSKLNNFANAQIKDVASVGVGIVIKPTRFYSNDKSGKRAFRSLNIGPFGINPNSEWVYFTNEAMVENKRTIVHEGDVLIVRSGNPGTCCVVSKEYDGCNVIDLIIARPDKSKILPEYLCAFTNMPHGMNQINNQKHGVAQRHFNVSMYEKMKIYIPNLSLQQQYVNFMKQVDKSKMAVQKSLDELETLKKSLMQTYFG